MKPKSEITKLCSLLRLLGGLQILIGLGVGGFVVNVYLTNSIAPHQVKMVAAGGYAALYALYSDFAFQLVPVLAFVLAWGGIGILLWTKRLRREASQTQVP